MRKIHTFILLLAFGSSSFSQSLDFTMLRSINKNDHPDWDKTMRITSTSIYPVMVAAPASLLLSGYMNEDKVMMRNGVKTIAAIGLTVLLTTGLKYSFKRERPFQQYPNDIVKRDDVGGFSFPSGHTSVSFATATALTLSTKKWYVAVPAYLYACFVGYSRMRLGVHFPSDVLGGVVVGIGSSLLVWQVDKWLKKN
jgi:membrane-associated phospholipid phosphatase